MTQRLHLTGRVRDGLLALRSARKFGTSRMHGMPDSGAPSEAVRTRCESHVNAILDSLIQGLPEQPTPDFVLLTFKEHLRRFDAEDTEERERACGYCVEIMNILGIESSQGVLNTWLYGFDPGKLSPPW